MRERVFDEYALCQADVLNSPLVIVARTDAEAATMIDTNIVPPTDCGS